MSTIIIAQYRGERFTEKYGVKYKAEIDYIHGNRLPHFSITGTLYIREPGINHDRGWERMSSGAIHEDLLAVCPDDLFVRSMVAMHLADFPSGVPMYAVENGFYHYQRGMFGAVSDLLRMPLDAVKSLPAVETKEAFAATFVEPQRARWQAEALAMWETFKSLGAVNQRGVEQARKYYNLEIPN